jgi:hypothetical protein
VFWYSGMAGAVSSELPKPVGVAPGSTMVMLMPTDQG